MLFGYFFVRRSIYLAARISLTFLGNPKHRELARVLLENHPLIKRIDSQDHDERLTLFFSVPIGEMALLKLLSETGIAGCIIEK